MATLDHFEYDEFGVKHALWRSDTVNARLAATFAASERAAASVLLSGLVGDDPSGDAEVTELVTCRMMLAALKVSEGDLAKLSLWVQAAHLDPRDLIAAAEYHRELQDPSETTRQQDLAEYVMWASGGGN